MTPRDEFCETIRIRLIQHLERNRSAQLSAIADDMGYQYQTLAKFANGTAPSLLVAAALLDLLPELGARLFCPTCKRIIGG